MTAARLQDPAVLRSMLDYIVKQHERNLTSLQLSAELKMRYTLPACSVKRHVAALVQDGAISIDKLGIVTVEIPDKYGETLKNTHLVLI